MKCARYIYSSLMMSFILVMDLFGLALWDMWMEGGGWRGV